jgi:2-methylisocitrate lyase-like PEP mutase family enzyme
MSAEHANRFRELHTPGDPLILVNVWDVASARTVAQTEGCRAIATASWSVAAAHGYEDGQQIPLDLMLAAVERIATAVEPLPATADLEAGFGDSPQAVAETVARAIAAGAVGANLEDRLSPDHPAVVAAVRERAEREGVGFVINARSDEYLLGERRLERAIESGHAFVEAGADCVFVPGIHERGEIEELVAALAPAPVNVFGSPALPPLSELAEAGVGRVSFGPGPLGVASAALAAAAESLLSRLDYPGDLVHRPPTG